MGSILRSDLFKHPIIFMDINKLLSYTENKYSIWVKESYLPLIICIDDDDLVGQELIRIFNTAGYQIILVNESFQALNVLLENKPDLIFLDLIMPVVNGYELCYQIRKIPLFKTTPIVTFMERDRLITRVRAKMAGATDFICKPIDEQNILAVTQKVLNL